jgi:phage/conjugal plasmid C-4 type zinc finger TraR family protein
MADIIDNASALEDFHRDAALSMHRIDHSAVSAERCVDCDDVIPDKRRVNVPGCTRCASCQQDEELRMKNRRM